MGFYPVAAVLQYDTTYKNTHITENNTSRSDKTQHTKLHKQYGTHYTQWIQRKKERKEK
jgi:hypothetical protein